MGLIVMLSTFPYLFFSTASMGALTSRGTDSVVYQYLWFLTYGALVIAIVAHSTRMSKMLNRMAIPALILISGTFGYVNITMHIISLAHLAMYGVTMLAALWAASYYTPRRLFQNIYYVGCVLTVLFWVVYPIFQNYSLVYDPIARTSIIGLKSYAGPFAHKNLAGGFFAICILIGLTRLLDRTHETTRWDIGWLGLMAISLIMTGAVTPLLSLVGCTLFVLLIRLLRVDWRVAAIYLIVAVVGTVVGSLLLDQIFGLFGRDLGFTGRGFLVKAWQIFFARHPFLGYGYNEFFASSPLAPATELMSLQPWHSFFNFESSYLQIMIDFGLIGFALFLYVLLRCIKGSIDRIRLSNDEMDTLPLLITIYLIISSFSDVYLELHNCLMSFLMFFIYFTAPRISFTSRRPQPALVQGIGWRGRRHSENQESLSQAGRG